MLISRRQLLKSGLGATATLVVGSAIPAILENPAFAAVPVQTLNFRFTDAIKEMVTHEAGNNEATCYFWCLKEDHLAFPDVPGPNIFATYGERIQIILTNDLDEPHAFFIPGIFNSGPIAPGKTVVRSFVAIRTGTFLYYDNLNAPVNRVMGLHGAFIVMPRRPIGLNRMTPYLVPTPAVQRLFNDLGRASWWPGLTWEQGATNPPHDDGTPAADTSPFRQWIWVLHQASPKLFAEVGSLAPGQLMSPAAFMNKFLRDPFVATSNDLRVVGTTTEFNYKPQFFTLGGQSGHFSHNDPALCPNAYVGEPSLVRVLNAGLFTHSCHIHANHVYVLCVNNQIRTNLWWVDTFTAHPMDTWDWLVPYMRPPDIPNVRGIGRADEPMTTLAGGKTYPPIEEMNTFIPPLGTQAKDPSGNPVGLEMRMSPLCFPMHDHSEPTQVAQGGNYNCGLVSGIVFLGDRNRPGGPVTFPGMFPG
jgi:FtsP/CotA-like multicopper oxidase with cupredoxin domain